MLRTFRLHRIGISGTITQKNQISSGLSESLQSLQRSVSQGMTTWNDHRIILHLSYFERCASQRAKFRQQRLADKIKINQSEQQCLDDQFKILLQLLSDRRCLIGRPPGQPIALDGMNHRNLHLGLSSGQRRVQPGKVRLHKVIFFPPGTLISDACRIIPLCTAFHTHPGQMRYSHGDTHGSLPVALQFMSSEIIVPAGDAVKFRQHGLAALLMHHAGTLLCRAVLMTIDQQIHTRHLFERPISSHGFTHTSGLLGQSILTHQMTGQHQSVIIAPVTKGIAKSPDK